MKFLRLEKDSNRVKLILLGFIKFSWKVQSVNIFQKKHYSQDGEDIVLDAFYVGKENYKGFYVDIGALHPLRYNNTQIFYEKGWRGINIDATPGSMNEFNKIRPNDINIEAGISDKHEELTYYLMEEPGLNNFSIDRTNELIELGWKLKDKVQIKTKSINELLEENLPKGQKIDFIDLDIEGHDYEVMKSFDFDKYAPDFLLIEELDYINTDFAQYADSPMYKLLSEKGYKVMAKTLRTVVYGKKEITV